MVPSDKFAAYANQTSTGTRMPRTRWKAMSAYPITQAFEDVVRATAKRIAAQIHESQCVATQRDALLSTMMSVVQPLSTGTDGG